MCALKTTKVGRLGCIFFHDNLAFSRITMPIVVDKNKMLIESKNTCCSRSGQPELVAVKSVQYFWMAFLS